MSNVHHKSESVEICVCLLLTYGHNKASSHDKLVFIMTRKTITAKTMPKGIFTHAVDDLQSSVNI